MYRILRFYNQNKKNIIKVILIIAFILGLIQLLDFWAKNKNVDNQNLNLIGSGSISNKLEDKIVSNKSANIGDTISTEKLESDGNIINNFMENCNNKDITAAYDLISDECKEEMYPTKEEFYQKYYLNVFNNKEKLFFIENWFDDIYKVEIDEDILATGNVISSNKNLDYITVVDQKNEKRLNINSFIGKEEINKNYQKNGIGVTIIEKMVYMDYEVYKLNIQNNTSNKICLDTKEETDNIYLENNKNAKIYAMINEIDEDTLVINEKSSKEIEIKFNTTYSSNKKINDIIFEKVIMDYKLYMEGDKESYNDYYNLKIDL